MNYSVQVLINNHSVITVPINKEPGDVWFRFIRNERTDPPDGVPCYTKPKQVAGFTLYVRDISEKYNLCWDYTKEKVADILWPESPQKEFYKKLARDKKETIRRKGWITKKTVNALSDDTCEAVENILDQLPSRISNAYFRRL